MKSAALAPIALAAMMVVGAVLTPLCANGQERTAEKPINQPLAEAVVVRVVSTVDCLNTPPTIKLIQETAIELGLLVDISRQVVTTQEEANKYRFIGSPTVQIDGLDLQPDMRANTKYGFT